MPRDEGIENKGEGLRASEGVYVETDMHTVHHGSDMYPIVYTYDAFRFSRAKEETHQIDSDT